MRKKHVLEKRNDFFPDKAFCLKREKNNYQILNTIRLTIAVFFLHFCYRKPTVKERRERENKILFEFNKNKEKEKFSEK